MYAFGSAIITLIALFTLGANDFTIPGTAYVFAWVYFGITLVYALDRIGGRD